MIEGFFAIVASFLALAVPLGIPLFAHRWGSLMVVVAAGTALFVWMIVDFANGGTAIVGRFLAGLMLVGFCGGAIAKFVMLLGRTKD